MSGTRKTLVSDMNKERIIHSLSCTLLIRNTDLPQNNYRRQMDIV